VAHGLAIVAGWVLFFWGWQRVLAATADFSELRILMIGAAVVVPVVTVSWILHNQGIHRRKGPRRSVPAATLAYRVDFNGREIVADFRGLAEARRVDVVVDGAFKTYRAHGREAGSGGLGGLGGLGGPGGLEGAAQTPAEHAGAPRAPTTQEAAQEAAQEPAQEATQGSAHEATASARGKPSAAP